MLSCYHDVPSTASCDFDFPLFRHAGHFPCSKWISICKSGASPPRSELTISPSVRPVGHFYHSALLARPEPSSSRARWFSPYSHITMGPKVFRTALIGAVFSVVVVSSPVQPHSPPHSLVIAPRALPIGTCDPSTPCPNGACCGSNGLCGYSPTECGEGCLFNCDAKAACGQYGASGQQTCPLNVCCSEFGLV